MRFVKSFLNYQHSESVSVDEGALSIKDSKKSDSTSISLGLICVGWLYDVAGTEEVGVVFDCLAFEAGSCVDFENIRSSFLFVINDVYCSKE